MQPLAGVVGGQVGAAAGAQRGPMQLGDAQRGRGLPGGLPGLGAAGGRQEHAHEREREQHAEDDPCQRVGDQQQRHERDHQQHPAGGPDALGFGA
ncbi:MAG: hypothetical protein JO039_06350 [Solirubrobacterales bacterium]|nr:hypothetical protein [Solirubrobacterales bacterium]